ncbi:MAG: Crp/Fnr family transcriptional regulator [Actinomycetia bacterium]|nr:Crp/Fnr family transcriptional regulator [Actinomycetes bacterium]
MRPREVPLLSRVPEDVLARHSVTRRYTAGDFVFTQGEPTTGLWVILEGRCAVERSGPDGHVFTTGVWQPGDIIGIAGLWDGSGYPASARVLDTPTVLLWMERSRFLALHRTVPDFAEAVSRALAERLRYVQETVADTRGRPVAAQVATVLAILARRTGREIGLTHEDVAHMLGVKRETVTRVLSSFARRGWVVSGYGRITVTDPEALAGHAGEVD